MKLLSLEEIEERAKEMRMTSPYDDVDIHPFHVGVLSQYYTWALDSIERLRKQRDEANARILELEGGEE